jgi:beta-phosphoglucomutase-like phosphatase (HAD superfamily)
VLQFSDKVALEGITTLLCDADGNLFPSEEPAFIASTAVTNRFLRAYSVDREFTPTELRLATSGKNFRSMAVALAVECGIPLDPDLVVRHRGAVSPAAERSHRRLTAAELEGWVAEENREVTAYLRMMLAPDARVIEPLSALARRFTLAAVSSSATSRLGACFEATGLAALFPEGCRFSAEDSLPAPTSKPDPAIYAFAGRRLGIATAQGLAIEDSVPGAQSAIGAGYRTVGNLLFVAPPERATRREALQAVGVAAIQCSWQELAALA